MYYIILMYTLFIFDSSIQEPSLRSVDENWGGSLKSKVGWGFGLNYE